MDHQETLGRKEQSDRLPSPDSHDDKAMLTRTIVVIDDDRSWVRAALALLGEEGFEVQTAEDGPSGLELLEHTLPLVVILDVHLPRLGGIDILRELRRRGVQTPVVMVSGEDQASMMSQALLEGASLFLRKPVAMELLLRAIQRLLSFS